MDSTPSQSHSAPRDAVVEVLSVDLLDVERETVNAIIDLADALKIGLGWHYLLDLAWLCRELRAEPVISVLDAGAGTGILQWFLSERGIDVLSVDRSDRAFLPWDYRRRYRIAGIPNHEALVLSPDLGEGQALWRKVLSLPRRVFTHIAHATIAMMTNKSPGLVTFLTADLADLSSVESETVDAIVSISALEHNDLEAIPGIVSNLCRILRPGGRFLATVSASGDRDWYHKPSRGWVLAPETICSLFGVPDARLIGFDNYEESLGRLASCRELRDGLAAFYYSSGENGMPWGIWNPQYVPVGVSFVKGPPPEKTLKC